MERKKSNFVRANQDFKSFQVDQSPSYEVRYFSSLVEIFKVLSDQNIDSLALLNDDLKVMDHNFEYIKLVLSQNKSVPMALFYKNNGVEEVLEQMH